MSLLGLNLTIKCNFTGCLPNFRKINCCAKGSVDSVDQIEAVKDLGKLKIPTQDHIKKIHITRANTN